MNKQYKIERYDFSNDNSLRAWSAADEYLLESYLALKYRPDDVALYNDRFGYLTCHLSDRMPIVIINQKSQEKAIATNLSNNDLPSCPFHNPLDTLERFISQAVLKIPKSIAMFELYLEQIVHNSADDLVVLCGFMTRHFSPKLIKIAEQYFEVVEQSKAKKKARVLTLRNKKTIAPKELISKLNFEGQEYQQYKGVFSGQHIDYATQYLIKHIELKDTDNRVLDLGSGNGVIAHEILKKRPSVELHLIDDSYLAVASAKLNIDGKNIHHHFENDLSSFEDESFDLIVTNPPFHFEYEINIQVSIELFRQCHRCLKYGSTLQLVANKHLNYKTHLTPMFATVEIVAEDAKFVIYRCVK